MDTNQTTTQFVLKVRVDGETVRTNFTKYSDLSKAVRALFEENETVRVRLAKRQIKVRTPKAPKEEPVVATKAPKAKKAAKPTTPSTDTEDDAAIEAALNAA